MGGDGVKGTSLPFVSRAIKTAKNPDFIPATMDTGSEKWTNKWLIYIAQLFKGQVIKTFKKLKQKFNFSNPRFLQIHTIPSERMG